MLGRYDTSLGGHITCVMQVLYVHGHPVKTPPTFCRYKKPDMQSHVLGPVCRYRVVRRDPEWVPGSAFLMTKAIQQAPKPAGCMAAGQGRQQAGGSDLVVGQTRGADGVFVWEVPGRERK